MSCNSPGSTYRFEVARKVVRLAQQSVGICLAVFQHKGRSSSPTRTLKDSQTKIVAGCPYDLVSERDSLHAEHKSVQVHYLVVYDILEQQWSGHA